MRSWPNSQHSSCFIRSPPGTPRLSPSVRLALAVCHGTWLRPRGSPARRERCRRRDRRSRRCWLRRRSRGRRAGTGPAPRRVPWPPRAPRLLPRSRCPTAPRARPPTVPLVSPARTLARTRVASSTRRRSPVPWPKESFTLLKSSRSRNTRDEVARQATGVSNREAEPVEEQAPVRQTREIVVVGEVAPFLPGLAGGHELGLERVPLRDRSVEARQVRAASPGTSATPSQRLRRGGQRLGASGYRETPLRPAAASAATAAPARATQPSVRLGAKGAGFGRHPRVRATRERAVIVPVVQYMPPSAGIPPERPSFFSAGISQITASVREQQRRDRSGVLQRGADDLGRVDHARLDQVLVGRPSARCSPRRPSCPGPAPRSRRPRARRCRRSGAAAPRARAG